MLGPSASSLANGGSYCNYYPPSTNGYLGSVAKLVFCVVSEATMLFATLRLVFILLYLPGVRCLISSSPPFALFTVAKSIKSTFITPESWKVCPPAIVALDALFLSLAWVSLKNCKSDSGASAGKSALRGTRSLSRWRIPSSSLLSVVFLSWAFKIEFLWSASKILQSLSESLEGALLLELSTLNALRLYFLKSWRYLGSKYSFLRASRSRDVFTILARSRRR